MKLNKNSDTNILIVGLGLLGGSYARALTKKGYTVTAITKEQESVDFALKNGIVKAATTTVDENLVKNADLIVFALYPHVFIEWIKQYKHLLEKGTVITDVTGVKSAIVYEIQEILGDSAEFIAAHPMAGRESSGIENSDDSVFSGANYIVVPTENNTENAIELCKELGRELGFKDISVLSPSEHDKTIAFLSQLTHCIAVSLMCCCEDEEYKFYSGDSFRDLTRIAKINDAMWSELFLLNKNTLLEQMDLFKDSFDRLYDTIKNEDTATMRKMMRCSTERRRHFDKKEK